MPDEKPAAPVPSKDLDWTEEEEEAFNELTKKDQDENILQVPKMVVQKG